MTRTILTAPLILTLALAANTLASDLPVGNYKLITESEWGVDLEIVSGNEFIVSWGAYIAGKPETLETKSYRGNWSCTDNAYTFRYVMETANAVYNKSKDYPLGVFKDKKAIIFSGAPERGKYLSGYKFWPVSDN